MGSLSQLGEHGIAMVRAQASAVNELGLIGYVRSRPRAARNVLVGVLLDLDSLLMEVDEVHQHWADRSGEYSPEFYADFGPDEGSVLIRAILDEYVTPEAKILELGCSVGRHLAYLREHGYRNVSGIEINEDALTLMKSTYPALASDGMFYLDALENVIPTFEDDQFDVVFSVETLELIHPDNEWIFKEVARITGELLITMENENKGDRYLGVENIDDFPLYYRQWNSIFTDLGLKQIASSQEDIDTFRVFQKVQPGT